MESIKYDGRIHNVDQKMALTKMHSRENLKSYIAIF
jgi:hypothetical protein